MQEIQWLAAASFHFHPQVQFSSLLFPLCASIFSHKFPNFAQHESHQGFSKKIWFKGQLVSEAIAKEVQIACRLFLVNCYLLNVPRLPFQPASNMGG